MQEGYSIMLSGLEEYCGDNDCPFIPPLVYIFHQLQSIPKNYWGN